MRDYIQACKKFIIIKLFFNGRIGDANRIYNVLMDSLKAKNWYDWGKRVIKIK